MICKWRSAVGLVVMMGRCQRLDPSSILGRRNFNFAMNSTCTRHTFMSTRAYARRSAHEQILFIWKAMYFAGHPVLFMRVCVCVVCVCVCVCVCVQIQANHARRMFCLLCVLCVSVLERCSISSARSMRSVSPTEIAHEWRGMYVWMHRSMYERSLSSVGRALV